MNVIWSKTFLQLINEDRNLFMKNNLFINSQRIFYSRKYNIFFVPIDMLGYVNI